jgi:hypothetical protein
MATLRQRFDRNQIPMQTVAALSGTHLAEVSRLVSGRGQKVLDSKAAAIESALTQIEHLLRVAKWRPDLADVATVRKAIKALRPQIADSIIDGAPAAFAVLSVPRDPNGPAHARHGEIAPDAFLTEEVKS